MTVEMYNFCKMLSDTIDSLYSHGFRALQNVEVKPDVAIFIGKDIMNKHISYKATYEFEDKQRFTNELIFYFPRFAKRSTIEIDDIIKFVPIWERVKTIQEFLEDNE